MLMSIVFLFFYDMLIATFFCDSILAFKLFVNTSTLSFFISTHSELFLVHDRLLIFYFSFDCVQIF